MPTASGSRPVATILSWTRRAASLIAIASLGPLVILPLGWQEQAVLGGAFIAAAVLLNLGSRARTVTCALIVVSIFSTIRYGYFRVTQTWDGLAVDRYWRLTQGQSDARPLPSASSKGGGTP